MANQSSNCPSTNSTQNQTNKPISSFLGSPRIFNGLLTRSLSDIGNIKTNRGRLYDAEIVTSPNSILDGMQNLNVGNPFGYDRKPSNPITKNRSQFQTSGGRLYDSECVVSPNSIHDGMQNHNLGNPFGYDRKTPNPLTKKPTSNKVKSGTTQTSRGRLYDAEVVVSPNFILNHNLGNPFGYDRKSLNPLTKMPPSNKMESKITQTSRDRLYDAEGVDSPNSILDGMQNHNLGNPFGYDRKTPNPITRKPPNKKLESESIGLALVDPKVTSEKSPVLFGAKLKVEIPCSIEVKNTCEDFGEMESSEDYTCVISHGPNPRTTHIFDNCIVERCFGVRKLRKNSCKIDHTEGKDI